MPKDVVSVDAGPWDDRGRRPFRYIGARLNKPIRMEQAIIEIGPHIVRFRGVDGFWVGVVETGQIPRAGDHQLAQSSRAEKRDERERVVRFLMDMGWNPEARKELDRLGPRLSPGRPQRARRECSSVHHARPRPSERRVRGRRRAARPSNTSARQSCSRRSGEKGIPTELQIEAHETSSARTSSSMSPITALAADLRKLAGGLPGRSAKILEGSGRRSDQGARGGAGRRSRPVRRLAQGRSRSPEFPTQAQFALAMSGYVAGPDRATAS